MRRTTESNFGNEQELFSACSEYWRLERIFYVHSLTNYNYQDISVEDKIQAVSYHIHLKACDFCRRGLLCFKCALALDTEYKDICSSAQFRILRENERFLDSLLE